MSEHQCLKADVLKDQKANIVSLDRCIQDTKRKVDGIDIRVKALEQSRHDYNPAAMATDISHIKKQVDKIDGRGWQMVAMALAILINIAMTIFTSRLP